MPNRQWVLTEVGLNAANQYEYVKSIGYDKFGNRKYIAYGNGTQTSYSYDALNLRMNALQTTTANGRLIQNNTYIYDAVGNILNLTNNADEVTEENLHGGPTINSYTYDNRYRLVNAEGTFSGREKEHKYTTQMKYGDTGNILRKQQSNQFRKYGADWNTEPETSMDYTYSYDGQKPHAVSSITDAETETLFTYTYDGSGNNLLETNSKASSDREIVWTEDNRMAAIKARGNVSHYVYDAGGIRTLKMNSTSFNISINGVTAGATAVDGNFTLYANPYTVVRQNQCTKHFFLGAQRILTKISSADVSKTFYEGNAQDEVANIDYSGKQTSLEENMHLNTEKLNIGWYRNTHGQVPSAHIKHYLLAKEYGGLSGQNPWAGDDALTDSTQVTSPTYEQKQYYYHPDHLGSSNYLTDVLGETYQHVEYLPWGETFLEERNTQTDRNTYLYTGKELDLMTGLYYYEQRYFDPKRSIFLSVDQLEEKYPSISSYAYVANNPIKYIDPDGNEVTNPNSLVVNNSRLINKVADLNQLIVQRTGLSSSSFTIRVSGGDRYVKDGKIYSLSNNKEIKGAASKSRHLISEGARAIDLQIDNSGDGLVTNALLMELATEVGFTFTREYKTGHVHLQLSESYSMGGLTENDRNIPSYSDLNVTTIEREKDEKFLNTTTQWLKDADAGRISYQEFYERVLKYQDDLNK